MGFIGHHANHASSATDRIRGYDMATQEFNPAYSQNFKLNIVDTLENFNEIFTAYMQPTAQIFSSHLHGPAIMHDFLDYRPYVIDQNPRRAPGLRFGLQSCPAADDRAS